MSAHDASAPIGRETPARLETIVPLAFPDGSVTVATLRKEIAAGRLTAWLIGGKHMTSLVEIDRMIQRCRVKPKESGSTGGSHGEPQEEDRPKKASGKSSTDPVKSARDAAKETVRALKERLQNTSPKSTKSRASNVISLTSR